MNGAVQAKTVASLTKFVDFLRERRKTDPLILLLGILLSVVGIWYIFGAGGARSEVMNRTALSAEFKQQVFVFFAGLGVFSILRLARESWLKKSAVAGWIICTVLMLLVVFAGDSQNSSQRWLAVGGVRFQPSEFCKYGLVIMLAAAFAGRKLWPKVPRTMELEDKIRKVFPVKLRRAWPAIAALFVIVLIELGQDLGTAGVLIAILMFMCVWGRVSWKSLGALALVLVLCTGYYLTKEGYRSGRISSHITRWEAKNLLDKGFQTTLSESAQARGGLLGTGPYTGTVRLWMPATTNDFILATIGEESGFVGAALCILLTFALVFRLLWHAGRMKGPFASLVLMGSATWIGIQAGTNILMANATIPTIGIPWPFLSSGGSSLFALWMMLGACQACVASEAKRNDELAADSGNSGKQKGSGARSSSGKGPQNQTHREGQVATDHHRRWNGWARLSRP